MALYHFHVGQIKRSAGQSAIACAAYRAGEKLYSEYYGEHSDYTRKGGILHTEIFLPPNAPRDYLDRQTLWNAVEKVEKNKKAQLAYSFDIALQNELSTEENIVLARQFVQDCLVSKGMIADLAIHEPEKQDGGISNPHFHVMTTMRPLNPDGTWGSKQRREYMLDENGERKKDANGNDIFNAVHTTDWETPETLDQWRADWCRMVNEAFERNGIDARIDHHSYETQGVDIIPTTHEGPQIQKMESQGIHTNKADLNRWIAATNRLFESLKKTIQILKEWIAEIKAQRQAQKEQQNAPWPGSYITEYFRIRNQNAWSEIARTNNFHKQVAAYNFIMANNLRTMEDFEALLDDISSQVDQLSAQSRANANHIKQLDEMIRFATNIQEYQPLINQLNSIHWKHAKEKFRESHQNEIRLYQMSKRILKQNHGITEPDIAAWKQEKNRLQCENENSQEQYKPLKQKLSQLMELKHQIETVQKSQSREQEQSFTVAKNKGIHL